MPDLPTPPPCPLRYDWLEWPEDKCKDRLFMICPVCKKQGCHVGEKENSR